MAKPLCRGHVTESKALTHDVKEITIRSIDPPQLRFLAGQYVSIEVTEMKDGVSRRNNRPYSIASPPEEKGLFQLCVNLVTGGPGSSLLHCLSVGDGIQYLYPLGYFTVNETKQSDVLFVATGTGIAPIRSMIRHVLNTGCDRKMTLYWGLRSERDLYYQEEFQSLAKNHSNFQFIQTLSKPTDGWVGLKGRVTHHLPDAISSIDNLDVYLCGNGEMIKEVRQMLLHKGMNKKSIHFEKFY